MTRKEMEQMVVERIRSGLPIYGWMMDIAIEMALRDKEEQENA